MRLMVTLLWLLAALLWLPWSLLALRLGIDLALMATPYGHSWGSSPFVEPVFGALLVNFAWPSHWEGLTPVGGWFTARVGSLYPWAALAGCGLTALGWRLYWLAEEGRTGHSAAAVVFTTLVPPAASLLMLRDARRRYEEAEAALAASRADALQRLQRG